MEFTLDYTIFVQILRVMKTRLLLLTILSLLGLTSGWAEDFYYKNYEVTVLVHEDNSYSVTEDMDAFFTAPRHGIVRDWTTGSYMKRMLPGKDGKNVEKLMYYNASFENVTVSENYVIDTENGYALKIGDADILVEGDHNYHIGYDYKVGDDRTPVDDLFYFSLLGAYNETNTEHFTFSIRFDKPVPQESLSKIKLFYGANGNEENKASTALTLVTDTLIKGEINKLNAHEAVSIYMPLKEGYFSIEKVDLESEETEFMFALAIAIAMALMVLARECRSRNNFTKVIEYWPPKSLSSADLGYIYDAMVDPWDIISLIPYFANKGLLGIDTTSGHPVLTKKKDIDNEAPEYQKKLFNAFFSSSEVFDTANPPKAFAEEWLKMDKAIRTANKGIQNEHSWLFILLYTIASIVMIMSLFAYDITSNDSLGGYGLGIFGIMAYIGLTSLFVWDNTMYSKKKRMFLIISWIIAFGLQMILINDMANDQKVYFYNNMDKAIAIAFAIFLLGSVFMMRLGNMTRQRLKYIGHILGLKEFIEKSEKPLLDSLIKEHESYFYDILPYAVAFGLSEKWAKQFEGLNVKPADWYTGDDMSTIGMCHYINSNRLYSHAMRESVNHLVEAQAKAAASSGSGGGFSGGGFGGGGSHSW